MICFASSFWAHFYQFKKCDSALLVQQDKQPRLNPAYIFIRKRRTYQAGKITLGREISHSPFLVYISAVILLQNY